MKTKYILLYIFVGAAFLAVSAWVFFSHGKNAKAVRAKYKLGGAMLTCLAMLSFSGCGEILGPGEIMCYEPVVEWPAENRISLTVNSGNPSYGYNELSPGDLFHVEVSVPAYRKFVLRVLVNNAERTELQREELVMTDAETNVFDIQLSEKVTFRGEAVVQVQGVEKEAPEELSATAYGVQVIKIR